MNEKGSIVRKGTRGGQHGSFGDKKIPNTPIKLVEFPIWNQQYEEPDDTYQAFINYYCTIPIGHRTVTRAYQKYAKDADLNLPAANRPKTAPDRWMKAAEVFRWEDRAKEFWRKKTLDNEAYFEHRMRQMIDMQFALAQKNMEKAMKIAEAPIYREKIDKRDENGNPIVIIYEPNTNWSHKDSAVLAEKSQQMIKEVTGGDDINRMIEKIEALGFRVIDPTLAVEMATPVENLLEASNDEQETVTINTEEPGEATEKQ